MRVTEKERAAANANSDRPAKIKLHIKDSTTSSPQNQERFSQNNGIILRNLNYRNVLFQSIAHMQELMDGCFGITEKEFWDSLGYLTYKGYIVQLVNGQSVLFGGEQIRITAQSIRLLAGIIQDDKIAV